MNIIEQILSQAEQLRENNYSLLNTANDLMNKGKFKEAIRVLDAVSKSNDTAKDIFSQIKNDQCQKN